ncbi:MAG TPA: right-handed parallel beta-helix repeat-containing protein, partial [Anaerolineae bacterium]
MRVNKPVVIAGAAGEDVVISGADVIPSSQWTQLPDKPIWQHTPWMYRGPTHPNDNFHQLIGRTEQAIVDGKLLKQVLELSQMAAGTFYADPAKALYVWLSDGGAPSTHRVEASVRPVLMDITADHVVVRNLKFIHASNRAQQAALKIDGSENVVEDCITEWTNGVGTRLGGNQNILRRVVSRFNGQLGLSGAGTRNLMEDCKLEGNNVKGFSKDWEAGGMKAANTRNFQVQHCSAIRNDGPGFWFDID